MSAIGYTPHLSKHPLYKIWAGIKSRCDNPENPAYRYYGAKGVTMCPKWRESLYLFAEDMGPRPSPKHSVDRYPDRNGPYNAQNTRWATADEQATNRRNNIECEHEGKVACLSEWSRELGVSYGVLHRHIVVQGKSVADAVAAIREKGAKKRRTPRERWRREKITFGGISLTREEWAESLGADLSKYEVACG